MKNLMRFFLLNLSEACHIERIGAVGLFFKSPCQLGRYRRNADRIACELQAVQACSAVIERSDNRYSFSGIFVRAGRQIRSAEGVFIRFWRMYGWLLS